MQQVGAWRHNSGEYAWLAKAKPRRVFVNHLDVVHAPSFDGDTWQYGEVHGNGDTALAAQLRNKVKKCTTCQKPNAWTLERCNGCSNSLSEVPISFTPNIFSSFAYGIAKGPFPLLISLRHESQGLIVLDDLLSLTVAHLNVLPTDVYIPDWTALLSNPRSALGLVERMHGQACDVVRGQFWPHAKELFGGSLLASPEELLSHVCSGFNYPPSQYQLHLQFMIPPFLPFQWLACIKGVHFTPSRFFPYEYVHRVLSCPEPHFAWSEGKSTIEEAIEHYRAVHGVDYQAVLARFMEKSAASHAKLANWRADDFQGAMIGNKFVPFGTNGELDLNAASAVDNVDAVAAADKMTLQNYGRPYDANGKPSGTYYGFAKKTTLPVFV